MEITKKLGVLCNFIILTINKVVLILNEKLIGHAIEMQEFINSDNLIGLKKKFMNWNEIIKNYTNFTTCLNNMIDAAHIIIFNRRALKLINIQNSKLATDYCIKKIESLEKNVIVFIEMSKSLNISLKFLVDIFEPSSKEQINFTHELPENIKSLYDIIKIIHEASDKIEKSYFPKTKQEMKSKIETLTKVGEGEQVSALVDIQNQVCEFMELENKASESQIYNIILGGTEPNETISGFHIDNYIQGNFIDYTLVKKDATDKNVEEFYNFYEPLINYSVEQLTQHILISSGALDNICKEYAMLAQEVLPDLVTYYINKTSLNNSENENVIENINLFTRTDTYEIKTSIKSNFIQIDEVFDPKQVIKSVQALCKTLSNIMHLIDKEDDKYIKQSLKQVFTKVNAFQNKEEFKAFIDQLPISKIYKKKDLFNKRRDAKNKIYDLIKKVESYNSEPKLHKVFKPKLKVAKDTESRLDAVYNILELEKSISPDIKEIEKYYDLIAHNMNDLVVSINYLISPSVKETCIRIPEFYHAMALSIILIEKLAKKRFKLDTDREIIEAKKELESLFGFPIEQIYDSLNK